MKADSHALFAYGTLLEQQAQRTVFKKAYRDVPGTLRKFIKKMKTPPGIYPGPGIPSSRKQKS